MSLGAFTTIYNFSCCSGKYLKSRDTIWERFPAIWDLSLNLSVHTYTCMYVSIPSIHTHTHTHTHAHNLVVFEVEVLVEEGQELGRFAHAENVWRKKRNVYMERASKGWGGNHSRSALLWIPNITATSASFLFPWRIWGVCWAHFFLFSSLPPPCP